MGHKSKTERYVKHQRYCSPNNGAGMRLRHFGMPKPCVMWDNSITQKQQETLHSRVLLFPITTPTNRLYLSLAALGRLRKDFHAVKAAQPTFLQSHELGIPLSLGARMPLITHIQDSSLRHPYDSLWRSKVRRLRGPGRHCQSLAANPLILLEACICQI